MKPGTVVEVALCALAIFVWWRSNDRDVAMVTAKPGLSSTLVLAVIVGAWSFAWLPSTLINHDWLGAITNAVVGFLCARVVWHWWRRRRQGKPSRVLGLVHDLGHKLGVVNIPAEGGS